MPKSKVRKKVASDSARTSAQANETAAAAARAHVAAPSSPVYVGIMLGLMILGLVWLVVYYLWGAEHPGHAVAGQLELRDRVRADDRRSAHDHALALTGR